MHGIKTRSISTALMLLAMGVSGTAIAVPFTQCPSDNYIPAWDGSGNEGIANLVSLAPGSDMVQDTFIPNPAYDPLDLPGTNPEFIANPDYDPSVKCMHLSAGDGFVTMADGKLQYIFSFSDLTGTDTSLAMQTGNLAAKFPAPVIVLEEGQKFYLSLTNVGMTMRPDLADPHTVHFHGFPEASDTFDGVPDATVSVNMGASLSYFYNVVQPGTYMYHCHVEATEHMQMGMLGNLYVHSAQDQGTPGVTVYGSHVHQTGDRYAYNDGDASTRYDVEKAIQLGSFDGDFHDASMNTQPLPFANMKDNYAMLNGRGYPDTINTGVLPAPLDPDALVPTPINDGNPSQVENALVEATVGDTILLRISNLNVTNFYTLRTMGLTMKVVGRGARQTRGPGGADHAYETTTVTLGGGEAVDVLIEATTVGEYYLYSTNLNFLSNGPQDIGGIMTKIVIAAGGV